MTIQINFGENPSTLSDELLRMWCVEKVLQTGSCDDSQSISTEADELFNYIREGAPYAASWLDEKSPRNPAYKSKHPEKEDQS